MNKKPEYGFGHHLMLDGYGCDSERLQDINYIYDFLNDYPEKMSMNKIMPPYVFRYEAKNTDEWGISGFVLIAESHISIHTFPQNDYLSLDIFSCRPFNVNHAIATVTEYFRIHRKEVNVIDRGREFPNNIRESAQIVKFDRLSHKG